MSLDFLATAVFTLQLNLLYSFFALLVSSGPFYDFLLALDFSSLSASLQGLLRFNLSSLPLQDGNRGALDKLSVEIDETILALVALDYSGSVLVCSFSHLVSEESSIDSSNQNGFSLFRDSLSSLNPA